MPTLTAPPTVAFLHDAALRALTREGLDVAELVVDAVHARPGAETSVGFVVEGHGREEYIVATDAALDPGPHVSVVSGPDGSASVWAHPHDPRLPGLGIASDADELHARLAPFGVAAAEDASVEFLAYRPMRRAVVRFEADSPVFVKALRPERAGRIVAAARAIGAISPPVWDLGDGLLASPCAQGAPLAEALIAGNVDAPELFDAVELGLDQLGQGVNDLPVRRSWVERRDVYAKHLRAVSPELDGIGALVASIEAGLARDPGPVVPTHGDLNPQNVWIATDAPLAVESLIDVDTAGPGHRVDDHACLVAHLAAMDALHGTRRFGAMAIAYADIVATTQFGGSVHARAAAVLMSLAASHDDSETRRSWYLAARGMADRCVAPSQTSMREVSSASPSHLRSETKTGVTRSKIPAGNR